MKENLEAIQQGVFVYDSEIDWTDVLDTVPLIRFRFEIFNGVILPINIGYEIGRVTLNSVPLSRMPDCQGKIEHLRTGKKASLVFAQYLATSEAETLRDAGTAGKQVTFGFGGLEVTVSSDQFDRGQTNCPLRVHAEVSATMPPGIVARMLSNSGKEG